jgi:hypothetical protein
MTGTTHRPMGVSIVAILILLTGIGLLVRGILGLVQGGEGAAGMVVAVILLVVGLVYALVAKGIWNGNGLSRIVVTILTAIAIIGSVIALSEPGEMLASIIQIVIALVILALLYGRQAREYFA